MRCRNYTSLCCNKMKAKKKTQRLYCYIYERRNYFAQRFLFRLISVNRYDVDDDNDNYYNDKTNHNFSLSYSQLLMCVCVSATTRSIQELIY